MAEDDEIIDVEDNAKLSEVKFGNDFSIRPKITDAYSKLETFDEIYEDEDGMTNNKKINLERRPENIKSCCTNFKANHRLGETIALYPDQYGNPNIIIGPDCI